MDKPLLTIEVPLLPPAEYSPNSRAHWSARKRAGDVYGNAVFLSATDARNVAYKGRTASDCWQPLEHAELEIEIIFAEERIRDEDNHRARFKPGLDALVRAGIIRYDDMAHLKTRIICSVDPQRAPLTVIRVREGQHAA